MEEEIEAFKKVIKYIKKGWGADCADEDPNWMFDAGCTSCHAKRVIQFLENHISLLEEEK